ncbi:hypothetical protein HNY73_022832 [Argiope bruennichi]|uniref:Uncharacterized protein n=1 Tax=Argiope bruennichi TaxID=94029 RepID=A0A8T0E369_ARGBR|nr:hypothetical protein HNY73_022832 [Argiope bruennichi]
MHILQIFVLLCGLKKIFDQRIPDDWQNTKGIALISSELYYPHYFHMCYRRALPPFSIGSGSFNQSKKLSVRHFQWYAQQILRVLIQNERCYFPIT